MSYTLKAQTSFKLFSIRFAVGGVAFAWDEVKNIILQGISLVGLFQTAPVEIEMRKSLPQLGATSSSPNHDALDTTLSQAAFAHAQQTSTLQH